MPGLDGKELTAELKICKKKPRNFLFAAGSKLESHYLDLSKKKIPKSKTKEAKAAAGAPKAFPGVVEYNKQTGELEFKTTVKFADKQTKALRMLVKKRAGLTSLTPVFKLVDKLDEKDFDDEAENGAAQDAGGPGMRVSGATQAPPPPSQAPTPAPPTAPQTDDADESQQEEAEEPSQADAPTMDEKEKAEILKDVEKIKKELEQIAKSLKLDI